MGRDVPFSRLFSVACTPLHEITASPMSLKAAGIDRRQSHWRPQQRSRAGEPNGGVEQSIAHGQTQQSPACFVQRREIRRRAQINDRTQRIAFTQESLDASVVELEELLQHQTGEQLVLGELLGTAWVAVRRHRVPRHLIRDTQYSTRGFARACHIYGYAQRSDSRLS